MSFEVAQTLAQVKEMSLPAVAEATRKNTQMLFRLPI